MSDFSAPVETDQPLAASPIGGGNDFSGKEKVMSAICLCMLAIGKIGKEGGNAHENYDFASIDDFLAVTSQACGSAGIVVVPQEVSCATVTVNNRAWVTMEFDFIVCHISGQSLPPVRRSVSVMWSVSQSYGSAQSYALKQFLRSLFQIACGDNDDPDFQEQVSARAPKDTPIKASAAPKPKFKAKAKAKPKPAIAPECIKSVEEMISRLDWFFYNKAAFWTWAANFLRKPVKEATEVDLTGVVDLLSGFEAECKWHAKYETVHAAMVGVERPGQDLSDNAIGEVYGKNKRLVSADDVAMIEGLVDMSDRDMEDILLLVKKRYGCEIISKLAFAQGCELIKTKLS